MQRRIPQLDSIRGVAVLVVILHNTASKYPTLHLQGIFASGWMGVDLFFVLSGFLITGILLDTRDSERYFKNFYVRRCLRIWPLYYSLLVLVFVLIPIAAPSIGATFRQPRSSPHWAYPFYLQSFLVPIPAEAAGPLGVTWSLAIEEQFYLLWPLIVRFSPRLPLRRGILAVICVSPLLRLYLSHHGVVIYSNPFCRLDGLMAGAFLAGTVRSRDFLPARFTRLAAATFCLALPSALALEALRQRWIVHSLAALAAAAFIYLALFSTNRWFQAFLGNRALMYTGTISYGLYLIHKLPFDAAQMLPLGSHTWLILPLGLAGSYLLAAMSWYLLERPFLGLKQYFEPVARRVPAFRDLSTSSPGEISLA